MANTCPDCGGYAEGYDRCSDCSRRLSKHTRKNNKMDDYGIKLTESARNTCQRMAKDLQYNRQFYFVEDGQQHNYPRTDQHITIHCGGKPLFGAKDKTQLSLGYFRWRDENNIEGIPF